MLCAILFQVRPCDAKTPGRSDALTHYGTDGRGKSERSEQCPLHPTERKTGHTMGIRLPDKPGKKKESLYERIRQILELARTGVARTVNTTHVVANWLIGREIVEEEQRGSRKAEYGQRLIAELSIKLQNDYGSGYSATNLKLFRQFFFEYPRLTIMEISHTMRDQSLLSNKNNLPVTARRRIGHTPCDQSWKPGLLHPDLSWSMYRHLVRIESSAARSFYEIEAVKNNWSARELERQINSLL